MDDELTKVFAGILAGIQVQGSMGMLGKADIPWREARRLLRLDGWHSEEEAEEAIKKYLELVL